MLSGKVSHDKDISGVIKSGNTGIIVSDEGSEVQILEFDNSSVKIVGKTPLLPLGQEADFEAVAASPDGWFYATGSHGVTKKKAAPAPSRECVFRFKLSPSREVTNLSQASLTPHLRKIPELAPFIRKSLQSDGLNIEGLAISGDNLYFGLRRPNGNQAVYIVEIPSLALFEDAPGVAKLHRISAHPANGIRALETLNDGSLLILLSGKKSTAFIARWNPEKPNEFAAPLSVSSSNSGGKAEAVVILEETPEAAVFAILYDSIPGGGSRTFRLELAP